MFIYLFIAGLIERKILNDDEDDDEDDDDDDDEEEEEEEDDNETKELKSSNTTLSALTSQLHPQLCGGIVALLEEISNLWVQCSQELDRDLTRGGVRGLDGGGSSVTGTGVGGGTGGGVDVGTELGTGVGGVSHWRGKNSLLLDKVTEGACSALCTLLDSSYPCKCPVEALCFTAERTVYILTTAPMHYKAAPVITVATAIVRQLSECSQAPLALLSRLPFLCLKRSLQILQALSTVLPFSSISHSPSIKHPHPYPPSLSFPPPSDDYSGDLQTVLESLRLVRQCCLLCPSLLSLVYHNTLNPSSESAGNLFFECLSCLLNNRIALLDGPLTRMMNTVLTCLSSYFNTPTSRHGEQSNTRTALTHSNYHNFFTVYAGDIIGTLLFNGLFGEDESGMRLFSTYFETIFIICSKHESESENENININEYSNNRSVCSSQFSSKLELICGNIAKSLSEEHVRTGLDSTHSAVFYLPSLSPEAHILTVGQYMQVVLQTLLLHSLSASPLKAKSLLLKQSYTELCVTYRFGRNVCQSSKRKIACGEGQWQGSSSSSSSNGSSSSGHVHLVPVTNSKLIVWGT